uniref:Uncharacterized protein n=1 Tax=Arundo donax TaxID=35708 RepID=A0A0A8ZIA1_ARUDO
MMAHMHILFYVLDSLRDFCQPIIHLIKPHNKLD